MFARAEVSPPPHPALARTEAALRVLVSMANAPLEHSPLAPHTQTCAPMKVREALIATSSLLTEPRSKNIPPSEDVSSPLISQISSGGKSPARRPHALETTQLRQHGQPTFCRSCSERPETEELLRASHPIPGTSRESAPALANGQASESVTLAKTDRLRLPKHCCAAYAHTPSFDSHQLTDLPLCSAASLALFHQLRTYSHSSIHVYQGRDSRHLNPLTPSSEVPPSPHSGMAPLSDITRSIVRAALRVPSFLTELPHSCSNRSNLVSCNRMEGKNFPLIRRFSPSLPACLLEIGFFANRLFAKHRYDQIKTSGTRPSLARSLPIPVSSDVPPPHPSRRLLGPDVNSTGNAPTSPPSYSLPIADWSPTPARQPGDSASHGRLQMAVATTHLLRILYP